MYGRSTREQLANVHCESGNISETMQDRHVVTTGKLIGDCYNGLSNCAISDDLEDHEPVIFVGFSRIVRALTMRAIVTGLPPPPSVRFLSPDALE